MTRKDEEAGNGGSVPRTGTIAVAGQVFSVTQGVGCTFTIAPTSEHAASGGGGAGGGTLTYTRSRRTPAALPARAR